MALTLRKATVADAADMVDIYMSAFTIDAISLLCFPRNNAAVYKWWLDMIIDEMDDETAASLVITTPGPDSREQIIAFGKWNIPSSKPLSADLPQWPEGADVEVANHFFGNLFRHRMQIMGDRRHYYLEIIATRPEWQGKGAAGKLMRWGLELADRDGVEAYLEASPDGKPIYEHFGFEERDRLVVDLEAKENALGEKEFVEVMMVRQAKS